jgi:hypothetical protein
VSKKLYVHLSGGLGNQLFTFASSLALSKQWSRELVIVDSWYSGAQRGTSFEEHRRKFELFEFEPIKKSFRSANWIEKKILALLQKAHFEKGIDLRKMRVQLVDGDRVDLRTLPHNTKILYGYLQNPEIFSSIRDDIQSLVRLPLKKQIEVEDLIKKYKSSGNRLIALHVRRGDYAHPDSFGCLLTSKYFANALSKFDLSKSTVLIFTDTPEWCKADTFLSRFQIIEEDSATVSLVLMSLCDDFVVSASTFSWWGTWLNSGKSKKVVAPLPYNEFDDKVWENLVEQSWVREKSIFESKIVPT